MMTSLATMPTFMRMIRQLQHFRATSMRNYCRSKPVQFVPAFQYAPCARYVHAGAISLAKKPERGTLPGRLKANDRQRKINVIIREDEVGQIMTKAQAEKLAREEELKLVLIDETAEPEPIYKLMSGKELKSERQRIQELKKASKKKEPKVLRVTNKITQHDLETKTKKIVDWVQKGHEVKILIKGKSADGDKATLDIFKFVSDQTKEDATVGQAQKSANEMVYVLKPIDFEPSNTRKVVKPFTNDELKNASKDSNT